MVVSVERRPLRSSTLRAQRRAKRGERLMLSSARLAVIAAGALLAVGCTGSTHQLPQVANSTFVVDSVQTAGTPATPAAGTIPTIRFEASTAIVFTGCNTIGATYSLNGDQLTMIATGGTAVGCSWEVLDQETGLKKLFATTSLSTSDG